MGNQVQFFYFIETGEARVDRIEYSGNAIKFFYAERPDPSKYYVDGYAFKQTKRIASIKMESDGSAIREYKFAYEVGSPTLLSKITEHGSYGQKLNPLVFSWGDMTDLLIDEYETYIGDEDKASRFCYSDFNGDGKMDFVRAIRPLAIGSDWERWDLFLANSTGTGFIKKTGGTLGSWFKGFYVADLDNDGNMDLLLRRRMTHHYCAIYCNGNEPGDGEVDIIDDDFVPIEHDPLAECCAWSGYKTESFLFYTFNGTQLVRGEEQHDLHFQNTPDDVIMHAGLDFNGDGRTDYLLLDKDENMFRVKISSDYALNLPDFNKPNKVEFLDFNGDGRTDIMVIKNANTKIYNFNSTTKQWDVIYNEGFPTKWHRVILGDFNGDGKTDILTWAESNKWYLNFSTGTGYTWPHIEGLPFNNSLFNTWGTDKIDLVKDFNGDGKDDVLQVRHIWSGGVATSSTYHIYQSNGDGTFTHESVVGCLGGAEPNYHFGDSNGDGINDIIMDEPFMVKKIMLVRKDQDRTLLQSVTDGLGRTLSVDYKSLPKASYTSGTGSIFPLNDYKGTFFVASKTQFTYPGLPTTTNVFNYTGATIHRQGKGFLGFKKFKKTNQTTGDWTEMEFEIMPTFFHPMLKKTISGVDAQQTAIEINTNAIQSLGDKRFFAYTQGVSSQDLLRGVTVNAEIEFDAFGNITRRYTNYGRQASEEVIDTYVQAGAWCPSRVQSSTVTKVRVSPSNTQIQAFNYSYNSNGLLISESGIGLNRTYVHDSHGNMVSLSLTGNGVNGARTTSYEYDNKGRVTKITEPGNFVTKYTRLAYTGWVQKEELPNGNYISYNYDGFGRVTYTTTQVGGPTSITHSWANGLFGALTKITTKPTGLPPTTVWYDAYDREIRREESGLISTMITSNLFNTKGQLVRVTNPDNTTVNYTYDNLGRLLNEKFIDLNKSYSYTANTVTVTSPRDVSITKYDALGNVLESTVNGQKVTYTYNALSQPLSTTPQWGAPVTMEYDTYGFQSKVVDPSAGTIAYIHNALGELISQKNNRDQTCIISYDGIGRITEKLWADYSITYQYHRDGGGKGMLKKATLGDISEEYFYDSYGRMNKVQLEGAGEKTLSFQYSFNSYGGITSIIYPNGLMINREFQNGYPKEIKLNNGSTIWRAETVNQAGQITKSYIGNNTYHDKVYDVYGFPVSIKTTQGSNVIQHFSYTFDTNKGNMTQRRDMKYSLTEDFRYDELHRLTTTNQLPSGTKLVNRYGVNGNITQKTDVGNLEYNLMSNVYAVTGVDGYSNYEPQSQKVAYTPFEKPSDVTNGAWMGEFTYGPDQQRRLMKLYEKGVLSETWLYFGSYEEKQLPNGNVYKYCYVNSPEGPIALYQSLNSVSPTRYNILTDHLGSATALVDEGGNIVEEYSYDAWGRRRNPTDYRDYSIDESQLMINRGYTFHEHLGKLDVINMNARMYDYALGRFLSPDPLVQSPTNAQNYNRYSYCLNNPLVYTDPDGESIVAAIIIGAVIGTYMGGTLANNDYNPFKWDYSSGKTWGYMAGGAIIGGVAGYAGFATFQCGFNAGIAAGSSGLSSSFQAGMLSGMTAGAINGGGFTALGGGGFSDIMGGITMGAVVGGFSGAVGGATLHGAHQIFNRVPGAIRSYLMPNTLSYMASSTTSQITANILSGKRFFEEVDYGFNFGVLIPMFADVSSFIKPVILNVATRNNPKEYPIESVQKYITNTKLQPNGDLEMNSIVYGYEYCAEGNWFSRAGRYYTISREWGFVSGPFISNYNSLIMSLILNR